MAMYRGQQCCLQLEDNWGIDEALGKWQAYTAYIMLSNSRDGNLFPVMVDIIRGPKEALGKEYQS